MRTAMTRATLVVLAGLWSGCLLDPRGTLEQAALRVRLQNLPAEAAEVTVTATDERGQKAVRRAPLSGQQELVVIFTAGSLAKGPATVGAAVRDGAGADLSCAAASAETGTGRELALPVSPADDDSNCGACGQSCRVPHASRRCEARVCGAVSCEAGWIDANGSPDDGCERACTPTGAEASEAACTDAADNDCDAKADCDDDDCARVLRGCTFMSCAGQEQWDCRSRTWGTCGVNEGQEASVAACSDTVDNDCDGQPDCLDPGCGSLSRTCTYQSCPGVETWTCAGNTWSGCAVDEGLERTQAACSDGVDNDCDGRTDCLDTGCQDIRAACGANLCAGVKVWVCLTGLYGLCAPYVAVPETTDLLCGDGLDNDCDGAADCRDGTCLGKRCAAGKVCCADGSCAASCP